MALTGCGRDTVSNYELGAESLKLREYESAIADFELAIAEEKYVVEAYRGEGIAYSRLGKYEEAVTAFEKALEYAENSDKAMQEDVFLYLANAQYQMKDYAGSIASCDSLLEIKNSTGGHFLRGRGYLNLKEYEKAKSDFEKVIENSKDYNDYLEIYKVYQECGMKADGEYYLEAALDISGKDEEDNYNKGRVYYYLEEYDKAKESLTESLKKGYHSAAIYLGKVYVETGDIANARAMYQQCLDNEESQAKAYNGLAYCDILEGNYDSALENIASGLEIGDIDEEQGLLFNEVVAYEKKLDYETAKQKVKAYLEKYPSDEAAVKENYFLETR